MLVLVCGGRDFDDVELLNHTLNQIKEIQDNKQEDMCIVHGGARGADTLAGQWAETLGIPVMVMRANWKYYGKDAGSIRNHWMAKWCNPDLVVAFPGGRGTEDMITRARAYNYKVLKITYE